MGEHHRGRQDPLDGGLHRLLRRHLGGYTVSDQATRPGSGASVSRVVDTRGQRWVLKTHAGRRGWAREARAYRRLGTALGDHLADVLAVHRPSRSLVLLDVGSSTVHLQGDPELHRAAGAVLRRLHDATPARPDPDAGAALVAGSRRALEAHAGQFTARERAVLHGMLDDVELLVPPETVGCHLDYTPRNWLHDHTGRLRVIDFAGARRRPWPLDLLKLHSNGWSRRPGTREAFLDGYDHSLSADEATLLERMVALWVVRTLVREDVPGTAKGLLRRRARARLEELVGG